MTHIKDKVNTMTNFSAPNKMAELKVYPVLDMMNANGDNNSIPRVVDHWVYFNSKDDIDMFVNDASKDGFSLLSFQDSKDGQYKYVIKIGREQNIESDNIVQTVEKLYSLAQKYNGDYDGWGCPLMK